METTTTLNPQYRRERTMFQSDKKEGAPMKKPTNNKKKKVSAKSRRKSTPKKKKTGVVITAGNNSDPVKVVSAASGKEYGVKYNGKMDTGAPDKYKAEFCDDMMEFFDIPAYTQKEIETEKGVQIVEVVNDIPYFSAYARSIGVSVDTLHEWKKKYPEFSEAYGKCKAIQEEILCTNALRGNYKSDFAKFFAINNTKMREKLEVTGEDGGPVKVTIQTLANPGTWKKKNG